MLLHAAITAAALLLGQVVPASAGQLVQVVTVGKNPATGQQALAYFPNQLVAAVGSFVQFQFLADNHTATQSSFDQPCLPIALSSRAAGVPVPGFFSGGSAVAAGQSTGTFPVFTVQVQDASPIWVYCSTGHHCASGMSMVINEDLTANSSRSLAKYRQLAATFEGVSPPPPLSLARYANSTATSGTSINSPTDVSASVSASVSTSVSAYVSTSVSIPFVSATMAAHASTSAQVAAAERAMPGGLLLVGAAAGGLLLW